MPQRQGSCITPLRQPYVKHTNIHTGNRQRCIMAALLSKYASACGCVLPGISLTVVLPGYNVFKQLSPCHPGRGEGRQGGMEERREGGGKERQRETDRRGKREKLLAYTNQPQSHAWIKCQCVCMCIQNILTGQRLGNESLPLKCCHGVSLQERGVGSETDA